MEYRIPKRIIQTGKDARQSLRNQAGMANVRLLNPGFEYLFFDDGGVESFVGREFPQYRGVFDSFRVPVQRYDFFRYLAVYRYGGFYFDLDVLLTSGVSSLLELGCVFPLEGITFSDYLRTSHRLDWQIGNYAFGAAPGHPFLEAVIENCVRAQRDPHWVDPMMRGLPYLSREEFRILFTTGPGLISRTLCENSELAENVAVLLPEDMSDSRGWNCFGDFGVHLMEGTWRNRRNRAAARLAQEFEAWKHRRLVKRSRRMAKIKRRVVKSQLA